MYRTQGWRLRCKGCSVWGLKDAEKVYTEKVGRLGRVEMKIVRYGRVMLVVFGFMNEKKR